MIESTVITYVFFSETVYFHDYSTQMKSTYFTLSQKGSFLLVHNGFVLHKHRSYRDTVYWRCKRRYMCRGRVVTNSSFVQNLRIIRSTEHNHLPYETLPPNFVNIISDNL